MTDPQLLHFVIRKVTFTPTLTGYTITCYSNYPVHCYLRYTTIEPEKHIKAREVRGAPVGTYIDQCFVVYQDIEQNEPGDTYTHTFTLEPLPYCTRIWFYIWGTAAGELSPSASAIFEHHSAIATPYCGNDPANIGYKSSTGCNYISFPFKPCRSYTITHWKTHLRRNFTSTPQNTFEITLWTADNTGMPISQIGYGYKSGIVLPPWPDWLDIDFDITPTHVELGGQYAAAWRLSNNFHLTQGWFLQQDSGINHTCAWSLPPGQGFYYCPCGWFYPSMLCKDPCPAGWLVHAGGGVQHYLALGYPD